MINEWQVYFITRCDNLLTLFTLLGIVFGILGMGVLSFVSSKKIKNRKKLWSTVKKLWLASLICIIGAVLIPSTKQMCIIKVVPIIANNKEVQRLPNTILEIANDWLDKLKPQTDRKEN